MLPNKTPSTPTMQGKMTPPGTHYGGLKTPAPGGAGAASSNRFGNSPLKQMLSKHKKMGKLKSGASMTQDRKTLKPGFAPEKGPVGD